MENYSLKIFSSPVPCMLAGEKCWEYPSIKSSGLDHSSPPLLQLHRASNAGLSGEKAEDHFISYVQGQGC